MDVYKKAKPDVLQGTLDLMVLRTLETMGPQHGFGLAKRIQQISAGALDLNQGTLYPALLRLEQRGWISSRWGASEKNRRAKFYELTKAGRKQIARETERLGAHRGADGALSAGRRIGASMRTLWKRLTALFSSGSADRELSEEVEVHLEMRAAELRQQGFDPDAARAAARREFGGMDQMKEAYRDRRGMPWIESLAKDARYGLRGLRRNPAFTLAAVLSLALGIGANTAIFSFVEHA